MISGGAKRNSVGWAQFVLDNLHRDPAGVDYWLTWVDSALKGGNPDPEALVMWRLLQDRESAIAVLRSTLGEHREG
jgi:hypothetical protein